MPRRDRFLRTAEVAVRLQVSPKTVARWAKEGRLPFLSTLGGHRRFPEDAIEQIIEELTTMDTLVGSLARTADGPAALHQPIAPTRSW